MVNYDPVIEYIYIYIYIYIYMCVCVCVCVNALLDIDTVEISRKVKR